MQSLNNAKHLTLTVMFTGYAFILATVGLIRRLPLVRWAGMGLMGLAVFKLLAGDSQQVMLDPSTFVAFLNIHFLTFSLVLAALLGMAYWFWRELPRLPETEAYAWQGLLAAANLVGVWALSQEILRYFGSLEVWTGTDYFSAKHLSLTVLWAVYAIGVIGSGITLRSAKVRQIGMALLTIPVAKLFVFDVFLLERGYRVAAFVTLGVLLLGTGLVYQRYSQLDAMASHSVGSTNGPVVKLQCRRLEMGQLAKGVFGCRDGGLVCYIGNERLRIWESTLVGEMK